MSSDAGGYVKGLRGDEQREEFYIKGRKTKSKHSELVLLLLVPTYRRSGKSFGSDANSLS